MVKKLKFSNKIESEINQLSHYLITKSFIKKYGDKEKYFNESLELDRQMMSSKEIQNEFIEHMKMGKNFNNFVDKKIWNLIGHYIDRGELEIDIINFDNVKSKLDADALGYMHYIEWLLQYSDTCEIRNDSIKLEFDNPYTIILFDRKRGEIVRVNNLDFIIYDFKEKCIIINYYFNKIKYVDIKEIIRESEALV